MKVNKSRLKIIVLISIIVIAILIAVSVAVNATGSGIVKSKTFNENMDGYYVYFRAVDEAGNVGDWSNAQRIWIDTTEPTVTAKQGSVSIKEGDNNKLADYFTVVANGGNEEIEVECTINGKVYETTESLTAANSPYTVTCVASKVGGNSNNATMEIVVTPKDTTPPELTIEAGQLTGYGHVTITVTAVSDDTGMLEKPIFNYYLSGYGYGDGEEYVLIYSGTDTTITEIANVSTNYRIKVTVEDNAGNIGIAYATVSTTCFVAGTKVLTETGLRNIEDIQIGDKVYALNIDTNEREVKEVTNKIISYTMEIYKLTIGNKIVESTPRHEFYIVDKGWIRAYDLKVGDKLVAKDEEMKIEQIEHIKYTEPIETYNLTVDDFHTYLITEYELLVHNANSRW